MENASKALLIAGGVLIAILLLTLFSYLFGRMAESSSKFYALLEEHEITEFNQQFLNYQGRGDPTGIKNSAGELIYSELNIQDVITIVNLAKDNNKQKKKPVEIKVYVGPENEDWARKTDSKLSELMMERFDNKYKCLYSNGITIDDKTKLVKVVRIESI